MTDGERIAALIHVVLHGDREAVLPQVPRMRALGELQKFGAEALPALDAVRACLFGSRATRSLTMSAVNVLCSIGPGAVEAIPDLIELANDIIHPELCDSFHFCPDPERMGDIGKALHSIDPDGSVYLPILLDNVDTDDVFAHDLVSHTFISVLPGPIQKRFMDHVGATKDDYFFKNTPSLHLKY